MSENPTTTKTISRAVPRGLARTGPVLFSYGFRPFFLGAALHAIVAMALWIAALFLGLAVGGDYGASHWHAHEMLFGFAPAVLAGFLLTAVPNWTGRLPVSGRPLIALFALWVAGRLALLYPDPIGIVPAAVIDGAFLPALLVICAREIIAGRKWKDLKMVGALTALSLANGCFHVETILGEHAGYAARLAIGAYVTLIMIVGGRIIPSFCRNWLNQRGVSSFPVPYNRFDTVAILAGAGALACWIGAPDQPLTAVAALAAAGLQTIRLSRWRGMSVVAEPLLFVLHIAYGFIPLGFLSIALGAFELMNATSVLHVLTVGVVASMMLAVMTRATRGHTGRALSASIMTTCSYCALFLAALLRPLGEVFPDYAMTLYAAAGIAWMLAFLLFSLEYGPMLAITRRAL
ncbi:short-chain dehydrogenase [Agrobacterium sp. a22-2]|uniref:NnrS family protein n=1 Tax=Agrobacterium sp. a22-2 TaxID=2283840 RepID=UPI001445A102|nr:NnrS family protein [Agrobacterium sp. a22-2]NKN35299.1 short-chain dehydrogenase [Agrobacterium sp. a22-2]